MRDSRRRSIDPNPISTALRLSRPDGPDGRPDKKSHPRTAVLGQSLISVLDTELQKRSLDIEKPSQSRPTTSTTASLQFLPSRFQARPFQAISAPHRPTRSPADCQLPVANPASAADNSSLFSQSSSQARQTSSHLTYPTICEYPETSV